MLKFAITVRYLRIEMDLVLNMIGFEVFAAIFQNRGRKQLVVLCTFHQSD